MGESELFLVLGAIVIFGIITTTVNEHIIRNSEAVYGQQAELFAISTAQNVIELAKLKAFDENTINNRQLASGMTSPANLGPDGSETVALYDDVDDFNGYATTVNTIGTMNVSVAVGYVTTANLDSVVAQRTFYKRMSVTVASDYLNHDVVANYVFAYQKN